MGLFSKKKNTDQFAIPPPPALQTPAPADGHINNDFSPWDQNLTISKTAIDKLGVPIPTKSTSTQFGTSWQLQTPKPANGADIPNTFFSSPPAEFVEDPRLAQLPIAPPVPAKIPLPPNLEPAPIQPKPQIKPAKAPLPTLDLKEPEQPIAAVKKETEEIALPDFDDEELQRLEEMQDKAYYESQEKNYTPRVQQDWSSDPDEVVTEGTKAEQMLREELGFDNEEEHPSLSSTPVQEVKAPIVIKNEPRFVALKEFFFLKDGLTQARLSARNAEEEMFEQTYKRKSELYKSALSTFSGIQDKLMNVDTQLFEDETTPEVRE